MSPGWSNSDDRSAIDGGYNCAVKSDGRAARRCALDDASGSYQRRESDDGSLRRYKYDGKKYLL